MPELKRLTEADQIRIAEEFYIFFADIASKIDANWSEPVHMCRIPNSKHHPMYRRVSTESDRIEELKNKIRPELNRIGWTKGFDRSSSQLPTQKMVEKLAEIAILRIQPKLKALRTKLRNRNDDTDYYRAKRSLYIPILKKLRQIASDPRLTYPRDREGAARNFKKNDDVERFEDGLSRAGIDLQHTSDIQHIDVPARAYLEYLPANYALTFWDRMFRYAPTFVADQNKAQYLQALSISRALGKCAMLVGSRELAKWLRRAEELKSCGHEGHQLFIVMGEVRCAIRDKELIDRDLNKFIKQLVHLESGSEKYLPVADVVWMKHAILYLIGRTSAKLNCELNTTCRALHDTRYANQSALDILARAFTDADMNDNHTGGVFLRIERAKVIVESRSFASFGIAFRDLKDVGTINDEISDAREHGDNKSVAEMVEKVLDFGLENGLSAEELQLIRRKLDTSTLKHERDWLEQHVRQ